MEIDGKIYNDYRQLSLLGKIEDEYEVLGHTFSVHSLSIEDEIKIAARLSQYMDTITYTKALYVECLARIIDAVDGKPLGQSPLTDDPEERVSKKREEINKWSPIVVSELYEKIYLDLREREKEVLNNLKVSLETKEKNYSGGQSE